jgi:predicted metal-dependent peptidase
MEPNARDQSSVRINFPMQLHSFSQLNKARHQIDMNRARAAPPLTMHRRASQDCFNSPLAAARLEWKRVRTRKKSGLPPGHLSGKVRPLHTSLSTCAI